MDQFVSLKAVEPFQKFVELTFVPQPPEVLVLVSSVWERAEVEKKLKAKMLTTDRAIERVDGRRGAPP